jgi:hypothetical protein
MKKNHRLHVFLDINQMEQLKRQSAELNLTLSELVRQKLNPAPHEIKIELMLEKILKKLYKNDE